MNYPVKDLFRKFANSLGNIQFVWISVWDEEEIGHVNVATSTGEVWADGVLTFHDKNIYSGNRRIVDLMDSEWVSEARVRRKLSGPQLIVTTRYS